MYDFLVIGAGSGNTFNFTPGGIAAARRAASYGAKVAIIEGERYGGTCVNVGCVPKKVMWNAASIAEAIGDAESYGFRNVSQPQFDWNSLKIKRDAYIKRLNGIYETNLTKDSIDRIMGFASFVNSNSVKVNDEIYTAKKILIATGSQAWIPDNPGCKEYGMTSDGFFNLETLPKNVAIVGAGYIAVELAGIFHHLGAKVTLFIREPEFLRTFDPIIRNTIMEEYVKNGIDVYCCGTVSKVERHGDSTLKIHVWNKKEEKEVIKDGYEKLIFAVGRSAKTDNLNLNAAKVAVAANGFVSVNEFQETSVENIYAVGDVTVAIAAGRRLADRLFGGKTGLKLDYTNIASVVFSHPTCGSVGLSEQEAIAKYGQDIKIYQSKFTNMYFAMTERKQATIHKLICTGSDERIVGLHIVGLASDEILQGFAVAIKMGAKKSDFDNTVAIHPRVGDDALKISVSLSGYSCPITSIMKANQVKKNDLKESESYKKGLRAESLFRYIEMKEQELKRSRLLLLKSIVSKQRQKIAYESEKWERKLEGKAKKKPKASKLKKDKPIVPDHDLNRAKSTDTWATTTDRETWDSLKSLRGSRILSGHQSLKGSNILCDLPSLYQLNQESSVLETIPAVPEIQEHTEPQINSIDSAVIEISKVVSQSKARKSKRSIEESDAVTKIFKTWNAFSEFQKKYSHPIEDIESSKPNEYNSHNIDKRKEYIKQLHTNAVKNRQRIALYMSGEANYAMGVPIGFKVDSHAINNQIKPHLNQTEENIEKVNITEDLNASANRQTLVQGKRNSFIVTPMKGQNISSLKSEVEDMSKANALRLAQAQLNKSRRPTFHEIQIVPGEYSSMGDILHSLAKEIEDEEKPKMNRQDSSRNAELSMEEMDLLKSLAVMADDRLGLESNFLQKSLARTDSLIQKTFDLNASRTFIKQKSMSKAEKDKEFTTFLEEDPSILQFSSDSGTSISTYSVPNLSEIAQPKVWEHINIRSAEDFGSSRETSKARFDDALKSIPNSFNQLCLNIENDKGKPKLGVLSASLWPTFIKHKTEQTELPNSCLKLPRVVKYWKTSSSFDDDLKSVP